MDKLHHKTYAVQESHSRKALDKSKLIIKCCSRSGPGGGGRRLGLLIAARAGRGELCSLKNYKVRVCLSTWFMGSHVGGQADVRGERQMEGQWSHAPFLLLFCFALLCFVASWSLSAVSDTRDMVALGWLLVCKGRH